jgi:hypothetical protein
MGMVYNRKMEKPKGGDESPLAEIEEQLLKDYQRPSTDVIYETLMRAGGEPFGAPFEMGPSTLTEKIVRFFKQVGYFSFETFDKTRRSKNKFTRYGAARYKRQLKKPT